MFNLIYLQFTSVLFHENNIKSIYIVQSIIHMLDVFCTVQYFAFDETLLYYIYLIDQFIVLTFYSYAISYLSKLVRGTCYFKTYTCIYKLEPIHNLKVLSNKTSFIGCQLLCIAIIFLIYFKKYDNGFSYSHLNNKNTA